MNTCQNASPTFFPNKSLSKHPHIIFNFCDSNVYKGFPGIRFCSNIFFFACRESNNTCTCVYIFCFCLIKIKDLYYTNPLFNYNFINLFIKIINLINDDCI